MAKVRLSKSPLARPESGIHVLASKIQETMFLPNPDPLYVVLGTMVGNLLRGNPVWLVLVGPSSSGKTHLLNALCYDEKHRLPKTISVSVLKGPGALLSGSGKKDTTKGATGGLLRQIGMHGFLIIKDFTSMMSLPRDALVETIGAFRVIYDGGWTRPVGTDGGKTLEWYGKLGLLSACTRVIDQHHQLLSKLGERWVYYEFEKSDGYGASKSALEDKYPKETAWKRFNLINEFLDDIGVSWGEEGMEKRDLEDLESNKLYALGAFGAAARSGVDRDWRTKEITGVAETEVPTRLVNSLGQLYLGMEAIGLEEDERWRIVQKVALDSMPKTRLGIVKKVLREPASPGAIREAVQISVGTVRVVATDLEQHGIIEQVMKGDRLGGRVGSWRLTAWSRKQLKNGGVI